jgi:carboxymethylenebutenolidase
MSTRTWTLISSVATLLAGLGFAAADDHADHGKEAKAPATLATAKPSDALPPAEGAAKAALDSSPRHGEYADVKAPGGPVVTWVSYPERKDKAPVVIVIHEIFGLSDWIRSVADRLAADGFIAVAPDMLSGKGPGGGGTASVDGRDAVVGLIRGLAAEEVTARLDAVRAYAIDLPSANGKSATVGFCWGGSQSFAYAAAQPTLDAAVVYYGSAPEESRLAAIHAPVLGLYGGDDARITTTVEPTAAVMKRLGKAYEFEIFPGAGHGFLRNQTDRDGANLDAARKAWPRTLEFLRQHLGS